MLDSIDIRFGEVCGIKPFSSKPDSPRRKLCVIQVKVPGFAENRQSIGQFAHHQADMLGKTVLCAVNLGKKMMFGQASELLILGVPHPAGNIIPGDGHEAQATYLQPVGAALPADAPAPKPDVDFAAWCGEELRLAEVLRHDGPLLEVKVLDETWAIPAAGLQGQLHAGKRIVVARVRDRPLGGRLLTSAAGIVLLAEPADARAAAGALIY